MRKGRIIISRLAALAILGVLLIAGVESVQFAPAGAESNSARDTNVFGQPFVTVHSAWGDYDLDGDMDLYVVNQGGPNNLYRNDLCTVENPCIEFQPRDALRSPSFTKVSVAEDPNAVILKDGVSASRHAQWVDYDRDGDLDLYVVNDGMNRLFINQLFTPNSPYDPFSQATLSEQVQAASGGTYSPGTNPYTARFEVRYSQTMQLELNNQGLENEPMLPVFERDLLAAGVQTPLLFPPNPVEVGQTGNNIFTDPSLGDTDNFVTREVSPGMYLELIENGVTPKRFVILEVLGPNSLRIDFEGTLQISGIFRYRIMRDVEFELRDTDRFVNDFTLDGAPLGGQAYYKYTGFPEGTSQYESFRLTSSYLAAGDQILMRNSTSSTSGSTLTTMIQVDPKQFGVQPIPTLDSTVVEKDFTFVPRRQGGSILTQKLFQDPNLSLFQLQTLQEGDRIEFLSGANQSRIVTIASISAEGVLFLDSQPGSQPIVPQNNVQYEFIYEAASTETRRIFTDRAASFGVSDAARAAGQIPPGVLRNVKKGDWIVLDPILDQPDTRQAAPPRVSSQPLGTKSTFEDGSVRPGAVLEVLDILNQNQLIVDAYPSEVGLPDNYNNQGFPYQIRHQYGRMKKDLTNPGNNQFVLFDELSPTEPQVRNFNTSLQVRLLTVPERNPYVILSRAGANASALKVALQGFSGTNLFENIQTAQPFSVNQFDPSVVPSQNASILPDLEYRVIYNGIGGVANNDPGAQSFIDPRRVRLVGVDLNGLGFARGHQIAFLFRNPRVGNPAPVALRKLYRVLDFSFQDGVSTVATLAEDLDPGTLGEMEQLCTDAGAQACNPADPDLVDTFFGNAQNSLSVEYEILTTQGFTPGGEAIELNVKNETVVATQGFSLPQLGMQAGDAVEFFPALGGPSGEPVTAVTVSSFRDATRPDGSVRPIEQLTQALLEVSDASIAPFNVDLGEGRIGIKPLFAGRINENNNNFNQVTISSPQLNLTSIAVPGDLLAWYSANAQGALTLTTRVPISQVNPQLIQVSRRIDAFAGVPASQIATNPFYFRITRGGGVLEQKPAFRDERPQLDFRKKLRLNPDDSVRGVVLLDVYRQSNQITDPIDKRFKVNSVIARNVLELESIDAAVDTFSGYYYEIKRVERLAGDVLEHNTGNGIKAVFADFNLDGIKDLYLLNQVTNEAQPLLSENGVPLNEAVLLTGSFPTLPGTTQPVHRFVQPELSLADQDTELRNQPGPTQDPTLTETRFLRGVDAEIGDFDSDARPGLLIANREWPDRLFFTKGIEGQEDPRPTFLRSQGPADGVNAGDLFGLNSAEFQPSLQLVQNVITGDLDNDRRDDVYYLVDDSLNTNQGVRNRNALFLGEQGRFVARRLLTNNATFSNLEVAASMDGGIHDLDSDGYQDLAILNKDALHIAYPFLDSGSSVRTPVLSTVNQCAHLQGEANRSVSFVDANHDGWLDMYISRGSENPQTNVLCLSAPSIQGQEGEFFGLELIPRQLADRKDRKFSMAQVVLSGTNAAGTEFNLRRLVPYSYPHPSRVLVGAGSMQTATVTVDWSEGSRSLYPSLPAQSVSTNVNHWHRLIQPSDYAYIPSTSGALQTPTTVIASKTTNVEAVGGTVFGSNRENLVLDSLNVFLSTNLENRSLENVNSVLPQGTIKLYLDNSPAGAQSTSLSDLVPNGSFDGESVDWLISTTTITQLPPQDLTDYTELLDVEGNPVEAGQPVLQAGFDTIGYTAQSSPATTDGPIVLSQNFSQTATSRLSFLMVYSVDKPVPVDGANPTNQVTFTPYIPARKTYGFQGKVGNQSRWDKTLDIIMRGESSNLIYRADFQATPNAQPTAPDSQKGVSAGVDEIAPNAPLVAQATLPASTNVATNLEVFGSAEENSLIRAVNIANGSQAEVVQTQNGVWQVVIPSLSEGSNRLEFVAVDEYGNASVPTIVDILLDTQPPVLSRQIVTNINLTKALVSFETQNESASSVVVLRSDVADSCQASDSSNRLGAFGCLPSVESQASALPGKVIQCYTQQNLSAVQLQKDHAVNVGVSKARFGLSQSRGLSPLGLCPETSYQVDIVTQDALGNRSYTTNALQPFTTLAESLVPGDTDGDGIPDTVELSSDFPDLDPFDANDALLDFDNDGINNVEEYNAGSNMYDPFDNNNLPVPDAGEDRVGELALKPGIVRLDASGSNFNGVTTSTVGYQWRISSVPTLPGETTPPVPDLKNANASNAWFVAQRAGVYTVELVLFTDKQAATRPDEARIEILNQAPQVILPRSSSGLTGQTLPLDGRQTLDANQEPLVYRWVQASGPDLSAQSVTDSTIGIRNATSALAVFKAGRVGRYVFELVATDNSGASDRKRITYLINSANEVFPTANAGSDVLVRAGSSFQLQGGLSRGRTLGTSLIYNWQPVSSALPVVADECASQTYLTPSLASALTGPSPSLSLPDPGLYAFQLTVQEVGRGLVSEPECVEVQVLPQARPMPQAGPRIVASPKRGSDLSLSLSKAIQQGSSVYRMPVNFTVDLDGGDSYLPSEAPLIAIQQGVEATIRSTSDCTFGDGAYPYEWEQVEGRTTPLVPKTQDCSVVSFTPVEPGVYVYSLSLWTQVSGVSLPSPSQSIVMVVNDPRAELGQRQHVPYVVAPQDTVLRAGNVRLEAPQCVDEDVKAVSPVVTTGDHNYPTAALSGCSSLGLRCHWSQVDGAKVALDNPTSCTPGFAAQPGTYRFEVRVDDGELYSVPDSTTVVVVPTGSNAPQAAAGNDTNATVDQRVTLNGGFSIASGNQLGYIWEQTGGVRVILNDSSTSQPDFVPPVAGQYRFSLQVADSSGLISLPDEVQVLVNAAVSNPGSEEKAQAEAAARFETEGGGGGGGCYIVTAASGRSDSRLVRFYQGLRDQYLLSTEIGTAVMRSYYHFSPAMARVLEEHSLLKAMSFGLLYAVAFGYEWFWYILLILFASGAGRLAIPKAVRR